MNEKVGFVAVYAGDTEAEAQRVLAQVKASGRFSEPTCGGWKRLSSIRSNSWRPRVPLSSNYRVVVPPALGAGGDGLPRRSFAKAGSNPVAPTTFKGYLSLRKD